MSKYYARDGTPIDMMEWASLPRTNKRVAETVLPNGNWVSTVWLGLNHSYGGGLPLIFETMVFPNKDDYGDLDCERYSTEAEAVAGHERMVQKWSAGLVGG